MNQPNYNFSYNAGGLVNFVWKNTGTQNSASGYANNANVVGTTTGQANQNGNQQIAGNNYNNSQQYNSGTNNNAHNENKKK